MATLSKELQEELTKNKTLGQEGVDSIVYTPKVSKDDSNTKATLTIKIKNSALTSTKDITVPTEEKNIKELAQEFSKVGKDTFNFSEFTEIKANVLKPGQISAIALRNSSLMKEVSSKLHVSINDIYQVRMIVNQEPSKKMSNKLEIFVILNSGLTFGEPGEVSDLDLPESSKVNVTVNKQNAFNAPSKTSSNTLVFSLSPKASE